MWILCLWMTSGKNYEINSNRSLFSFFSYSVVNKLTINIQIWSGDEVIFQDDKSSCLKVKRIQAFLQERYTKSMTHSVNSPDLNPMENL